VAKQTIASQANATEVAKIKSEISAKNFSADELNSFVQLATKEAQKSLKDVDILTKEKVEGDCSYAQALIELTPKQEKKQTIKQRVIASVDFLKSLTTTKELRNWALQNGMDNRSAFPKFKAALEEIGVSYYGMKSEMIASAAAALEEQIKHEVTLYVDAKASAGRYGICDGEGEVLWHGRFFDNDDAGEQSEAELCAAEKAVWLASKIKEAVGATAIKLNLMVDAQWLTYQDHTGQKGYKLTHQARKFNIKLNVEWLPGTINPADKWTTSSGFKKWSQNNLAAMAKPYINQSI